ncbi:MULTISPECIES: hypothetical protein [unclassified Bradyrhizobium]|nr:MULTISPECIES: hypothetical protein [unclassified Bradyrhizobium]WGR70516.1 hypothetical protein MTX24_35100 [Bradyrhizobium sp. ISRA426]WGR82572.1 hypothetical protein MTX21_20200 [Bradyrhizobium sp. ISRA430]WGR85759.1 hypothetical protein MTX25_34785 [Bradyrhizobium sp. ISRA432]
MADEQNMAGGVLRFMDDRNIAKRMEQALVTIALSMATVVVCMGLLVLW